jgi:hypothetical protein
MRQVFFQRHRPCKFDITLKPHDNAVANLFHSRIVFDGLFT